MKLDVNCSEKNFNKKDAIALDWADTPRSLIIQHALYTTGNGLTLITVFTVTQDIDFFETGDQISKFFLSLIPRTESGIYFKTKSQQGNKNFN